MEHEADFPNSTSFVRQFRTDKKRFGILRHMHAFFAYSRSRAARRLTTSTLAVNLKQHLKKKRKKQTHIDDFYLNQIGVLQQKTTAVAKSVAEWANVSKNPNNDVQTLCFVCARDFYRWLSLKPSTWICFIWFRCCIELAWNHVQKINRLHSSHLRARARAFRLPNSPRQMIIKDT